MPGKLRLEAMSRPLLVRPNGRPEHVPHEDLMRARARDAAFRDEDAMAGEAVPVVPQERLDRRRSGLVLPDVNEAGGHVAPTLAINPRCQNHTSAQRASVKQSAR